MQWKATVKRKSNFSGGQSSKQQKVLLNAELEQMRAGYMRCARRVAELEHENNMRMMQMEKQLQVEKQKRLRAEQREAEARGGGVAGVHRSSDGAKTKGKNGDEAIMSYETLSRSKRCVKTWSSMFGMPFHGCSELMEVLNADKELSNIFARPSSVKDEVRKRKRAARPTARVVSCLNRFLFVCFVLRTGVDFRVAAPLFLLCVDNGQRLFEAWIEVLYQKARGVMPYPTRKKVFANSPDVYQKVYGQRIRGILDPTEVIVGMSPSASVR
jgi:hypothetical protein